MGSGVVSGPEAADLLDLAGRLADAAEAEARRMGIAICTSVIDPHGNPVLFRRMTGSLLIAVEMAVRKAETAVALRMSTVDLGPLVEPGQPLFPLLAAGAGRYIAFGGGAPIFGGSGEFLAGLGVSGGMSHQDAEIASTTVSKFR
jgi:uncharacterized protein GlcG (DUF336 family)